MRPHADLLSGDSLRALEALGLQALDPFFWPAERPGIPNAWWPHVPFAHWIVGATSPRTLVELGTGNGVSYSAFCQAVARNRLDTQCCAVDRWRDDPQSVECGDDVLAELRQFHDERYGAFSTLLRCSFDEALESFRDGSIDLLHVNGSRSYEAVSRDLVSWRPKLSDRAVVLLHRTNADRTDCGPARLWSELRQRHPSFEFPHGRGLGVLAVGKHVPPAITRMCAITDASEAGSIQLKVASLGERWNSEARDRMRARELAQARAETTQARAAAAAAAEWERRYHLLRGRLVALLLRFGLLRAWRLVPAPIRRYAHQRLLARAPSPSTPQGSREERRIVSLASQLAAGRSRLDPNRETVLLIIHEASRTGAPILGYNIATRLGRRYNVVTLLLDHGELVEDFDGCCTAVIGPPSRANWHLIETERVLKQVLASFPISYAIANSIETRVVLKPLTLAHIPVVTLVHEFSGAVQPPGEMGRALEWSTEIVFSADLTAAAARQDYPSLGSRPIHILRQGRPDLPSRESQPLAPDQKSAREALRLGGYDANAFIVLGCGTMNTRKGVDVFLSCASAVAALNTRRPVHFCWVGSPRAGDVMDAVYNGFLVEQIARAGLGSMVTFIGETADLDPAYDAADLFFMSSRLDPLPNVAIEAAFQGIPVVCFQNATGIAEVLNEDPVTRAGIVPYLDAHAAAQAIAALADDPAAYQKMREATLRLARRVFDMDDYVCRLDELGRAAMASMRQRLEDFETIDADPSFDINFFLGADSALSTRKEAIQLLLARPTAVGTERHPTTNFCYRRPCPGFHPQIYELENAKHYDCASVNALARFIRSGKPDGPWRHDVITPAGWAYAEPPSGRLRVAIHGHFHYPELAGAFIRKIKGNRSRCDLLLSTTSEEKAAILRDTTRGYDRGEVYVRTGPNRGRDIGAFLTLFAEDILARYDLVGHVHGKRSLFLGENSIGDHWREFLWQNLLGDPHPMADIIISAFAQDERLGIVFPDDPHLSDRDLNLELATKLAHSMGMVGVLPPFFDFPIGTMFWARTAALRPLFDLKFSWDDYPDEPLANDGTLLHALERLLPFAARHAGYRYATTYIPGVTW